MKYRALDANGDYQFGRSGILLIDSPAAVAQAIDTRLRLWTGDWFLDLQEGTPYEGQILAYGTQGTRDQVLKARILETQGVEELLAYQSSVNGRSMTVQATVRTRYGQETINTTLEL